MTAMLQGILTYLYVQSPFATIAHMVMTLPRITVPNNEPSGIQEFAMTLVERLADIPVTPAPAAPAAPAASPEAPAAAPEEAPVAARTSNGIQCTICHRVRTEHLLSTECGHMMCSHCVDPYYGSLSNPDDHPCFACRQFNNGYPFP